MAPFPEQEPMTIKRIEVALKKRDWTLFRQGIIKINSMYESGTKWSDAEAWQNLMNQAESEYIPPDLWEEFSKITKNIINSIDNSVQISLLPAFQEDKKASNKYQGKVVIFYNKEINSDQIAAIKKHNVTLNNFIYNSSKYAPEPEWFEDLSKLINNLDKPNNDMTDLLSLISLFENPGTIVTSSYDTDIIKNFAKSYIDFYIPEIKQSYEAENYWNIYPLGGLSCSYICSACGYKFLQTEFTSKTIVGSCSKCAGTTYPYIRDVNSETAEVNPKIWIGAYKKLSESSDWILINPPAYSEKPVISDLLEESAVNVKKVYIVTPSFEVSEWWKNKLLKILPDVEIINNFSNISSLVNKLKNDSMPDEKEAENFSLVGL